MICPYKDCGAELPDDSAFCDMCGNDIYRCTDPECGIVTTAGDKFCPQCGEPTAPNGPAASVPVANAAVPAPSVPVANAPVPGGETPVQPGPVSPAAATEFMNTPGGASRIFFRHSDGRNMELADGDILGRVNGNHLDILGSVKVISGTHARITHAQDGWYITDQKSLNKTWVNGKEAAPFAPVRIKQNDVVTLANVKFIVTEL